MPESFKKNFNGIEYAFYRTTILNDITYYIMFDENGKRNSVRVARVNGHWQIPEDSPPHINQSCKELIESIEQNEIVLLVPPKESPGSSR